MWKMKRYDHYLLYMDEEKKNFIVYSQKLTGYLMQKGFVLIDMRPDLKKSGRNVFFFNDTPQLKSAIDEYMSR